jgi:hypothetical protein
MAEGKNFITAFKLWFIKSFYIAKKQYVDMLLDRLFSGWIGPAVLHEHRTESSGRRIVLPFKINIKAGFKVKIRLTA